MDTKQACAEFIIDMNNVFQGTFFKIIWIVLE